MQVADARLVQGNSTILEMLPKLIWGNRLRFAIFQYRM